MLRKRAVAVALTALLSPVSFALGLGTLKSNSALNEPFDARIEIIGATAQDFDALTVKLADSGQFDRAGVARDAVLLNLRFEVVSSEAGADYIRVTTKDPVREPYLDFLLELDWANGRMVREYTVLLDPPLYDRNRQKPLLSAPVVMTPRPSVQAAPPTPRPASPASVTTAPAPTTRTPTFVPPGPATPPPGTLGPVQANDTAWGLALAHRPDRSISVHQMMLALLRANPEAFISDNVNQLRRGAILRMPSREEMDSLAQREAVQEIQRQHQLWQDYRQGVASTAVEAPMGSSDDAPDDEVDAEIEDTLRGVTTPTDPADDARLELAAPEDGEAATTPGGEVDGSLEESLAKETLDARARENTDLQAKLAEADQIIDLLQRQVEIKDEALAALQARLGEATPAPEVPATGADEALTSPETVDDPVGTAQTPIESEPEISAPIPPPDAATDTPLTAESLPPTGTPPLPAVEPTVPVAPLPAQDTGWRAMLNNLVPAHLRAAVPGGALTVLGIAATLLLLLLIGISKAMSGRRGNAIVSTKAAMGTAAASSSSIEGPQTTAALPVAVLATREDSTPLVTPKDDSEQFQRTMEGTPEQLVAAPIEDPLEEVNVYLAYERFDQAEELVTTVIAKYPYEHKYKLRLLEIYYSASNKPAYEEAARELHAAVGDANPLWESAVAMWSEMSPERALFAPGAASELDSSREPASAFVDITSNDTPRGSANSMLDGNEKLSSTQVGLTKDYARELAGASTLDFDLSEGITSDTVPSPEHDAIEGEIGADGVVDLTATTDDVEDDAELDQILDLTAGTEPADRDIFDISGEEFLDSTSVDDGFEMLDTTKTGQVTLDSDGATLDITSPRGAARPDRAEAKTIDPIVDEMSQEFDISDTVAPISEMDNLSLDFDIEGLASEAPLAPAGPNDAGLDDFDLTLDPDIESAISEAAAAGADIDLSLHDGIALDFDLADPTGSETSTDSEVEFDLALQDTTDFENLAIDDTLELPVSNTSRSGMQPVDAAGESLEDLTRSMEASIAGLDLDDDRDSDNILDFALEPGGSDGIDLDFGLDDIGELDELDTLALDPEELRRAREAATDKHVALPDPGSEYQLDLDETDTKLNLAKAYIELGDGGGARMILNEVIADGSSAQQDEARKLLSQLS